MKIGWTLLLNLLLCGCTSDILFHAHVSSSHTPPLPVTLGVYYTTGTLELTEDYKNRNIKMFKTWRVHVGEALKTEVLSRFFPMVKKLQLLESPYPPDDADFALTLGIEEFHFTETNAETILSATLRNRDHVVLLDKQYRGSGTAKIADIAMKKTKPEQGLGETTRQAMAMAIDELTNDLKPYLERPAPR